MLGVTTPRPATIHTIDSIRRMIDLLNAIGDTLNTALKYGGFDNINSILQTQDKILYYVNSELDKLATS